MKKSLLFLFFAASTFAFAQAPDSIEQLIDRISGRERLLLEALQKFEPYAETYIQSFPADQPAALPKSDTYFLGKVTLKKGVDHRSLLRDQGLKRSLKALTVVFSDEFVARGMVQMILPDSSSLDRGAYEFAYVRREFLGELRCLVLDVTPRKGSGKGRFQGRIWVEDQDFHIVRFNGTYVPQPRVGRYLHFDSWRVQAPTGLWLPAYVYIEEADGKNSAEPGKLLHKGQTRLWGYELKGAGGQDEFTSILLERPQAVRDRSEADRYASPVESQRAWERQAERNVIERLEKGGLLARASEVDKVLDTVVNNLLVTNSVELPDEVRCRVLLTFPLESFTLGHTIVLSRGLIDVLPDEGSLAMVLAHELAHVVLGHPVDTRYAFNDRMLFEDQQFFERLNFRRTPEEEAAANQKGAELLSKSPYKDKLANAGLFLRALHERAPLLPNLIRSHVGNKLWEENLRMQELMSGAPELKPESTDQIAALPLGARIKMNPWNSEIELVKTKGVPLVWAREKMPFEVSPFLIHLTRQARPAAAP
ncbi:MAG: hypothetical protein FJW37_06590 [Acidobacteria bacterium]|nr:hypothetical protein [Acidobacteriota bacterium]